MKFKSRWEIFTLGLGLNFLWALMVSNSCNGCWTLMAFNSSNSISIVDKHTSNQITTIILAFNLHHTIISTALPPKQFYYKNCLMVDIIKKAPWNNRLLSHDMPAWFPNRCWISSSAMCYDCLSSHPMTHLHKHLQNSYYVYSQVRS